MQVRSAKLGSLPLTSLSLLDQDPTSEAHPTVLAGSYDNQVFHVSALFLGHVYVAAAHVQQACYSTNAREDMQSC